jgi:hypothetical protein
MQAESLICKTTQLQRIFSFLIPHLHPNPSIFSHEKKHPPFLKTVNLPRMVKCVEFRVRCEAVANLKDNIQGRYFF